jgi:uncharacterized OB-fold protein
MSKPLFEPGGDGAAAQLRVGRCGACGHTFFPPQTLGCERCGAFGEALVDALVPAAGRVVSAVTVNRFRGPGIEAPFAIADIVLDSEVAVRVLMDSAAVVPNVGAHVRGRVIAAAPDSALPGVRFSADSGIES